MSGRWFFLISGVPSPLGGGGLSWKLKIQYPLISRRWTLQFRVCIVDTCWPLKLVDLFVVAVTATLRPLQGTITYQKEDHRVKNADWWWICDRSQEGKWSCFLLARKTRAQISSSLYPAQFLRRTGLARWVSCPDELFKEPRIES